MEIQVEGEDIPPENVTEENGWKTARYRSEPGTPTPKTAKVEVHPPYGGGTTNTRQQPRNIKQLILRASKMPHLPKADTKIVVRPRSGLNLAKHCRGFCPYKCHVDFKEFDLSEDYHQYYSDDVRLAPDVSPVPLPRIIHRSVTKTIRRWRTRGAAVVSSPLTERSSAEPLVEVRRGSVPPRLSARCGWRQQLSLGSTVITKPEEDRIYTMNDATPWAPLLSLCTEPKRIKFQQIIRNNSKVAAVSCNDSDRELFCLGSCPTEERLVRVLRLRQQDVRWHTTRLTLAREIGGLGDNGQNRTSAFFLGARTSLVHDTHPMLLWDGRHSHREGPVAGDTTPTEDLQKPNPYLVTEMQPGWRPLTTYKFPGATPAVSILAKAGWALAAAESALVFDHRLQVVSAVLVRPTCSPGVESRLRGRLERISSAGYNIRLQGLQMARMTMPFIQWSVTKTIRRRRTRGAAVVSSPLTERSFAEPLVEVRRGSVRLRLSARRGWLQQLSFGSVVITKPEEDRIYTMTDATPWTPLLSLCTEPKPIEFQQIIPNNSKVAAVSCNDSDRELFCLGSCPAEERLVRVLRLRQQDVRWHTTRLTLARYVCRACASLSTT
ncbi:hypothetical protein HPB49_013168 [Dermacentor silvarum]|uniref:Uncharacterized protein n=1 Tax=Dermacentor silvarum TaxID=543639 RepID=A0ACB8DDB2_DERSI|nr:hypothetical protein HPB49_013168 [Dermacentor silvarum]